MITAIILLAILMAVIGIIIYSEVERRSNKMLVRALLYRGMFFIEIDFMVPKGTRYSYIKAHAIDLAVAWHGARQNDTLVIITPNKVQHIVIIGVNHTSSSS